MQVAALFGSWLATMVIITGTVVPGIEGPALRDEHGRTVALSHLPDGMRTGDRIRVRGEFALSATRQQEVLVVEDAAAALVGTKVDEAALEGLAAAARAACRPINDKRGTIEFRTEVAGVLARRGALRAVERARQS